MGKNEVMPQSSVARPRQGICATVGGTRETEAFIFYTFDVPTRLICGRHPHDRPVSRPEHPLDDEDVSNTSTECMQEFTHLLGKLNFLLNSYPFFCAKTMAGSTWQGVPTAVRKAAKEDKMDAHEREPCPHRIIDDLGGAFGEKAIPV